MRLINTNTLQFEEFWDPPEFAILSHRWRTGEVSFDDMESALQRRRSLPVESTGQKRISEVSIQAHLAAQGRDKQGFLKILACCDQARMEHISYVWIDTCCIDKRSSAELSEAINSMYRWYSQATTCYAYLDDVFSLEDFGKSEWFTRGWTLQELIAPPVIRFYNRSWTGFGTKRSLVQCISDITRIDAEVLLTERSPMQCSIAQRMSWASTRSTTRPEDLAYSLMGLFEVNMPLLYGEREKAFIRLQEAIIQNSSDQSIFAWSSDEKSHRGLLAASPASFCDSNDIVVVEAIDEGRPSAYTMTHNGLSIELPFECRPVTTDTFVAVLNCARKAAPLLRLGIYLLLFTHLHESGLCVRVVCDNKDLTVQRRPCLPTRINVLVRQHNLDLYTLPKPFHGFHLSSSANSVAPWRVACGRESACILPSDSAIELPLGKHGTVGIIEPVNKSIKTRAITLGFDRAFNPALLVEDSTEESQGVRQVDHETRFKSDWINKPVDLYPGFVRVGTYWALHERGSWYFGANKPSERDVTMNFPGSPPLMVYIAELDLGICLYRVCVKDTLSWIFQLFNDRLQIPREVRRRCPMFRIGKDPSEPSWEKDDQGKDKEWCHLLVEEVRE